MPIIAFVHNCQHGKHVDHIKMRDIKEEWNFPENHEGLCNLLIEPFTQC